MITLYRHVKGFNHSASRFLSALFLGDGDLVKMFAKERKEMREEQKEMRADFRRENDEQNRVIAEQKKQNDEQNRVIAEQKEEMKRLHKRLHRADLKNKEAHRQRDAKESKELEAKVWSTIRQERHSSDLEDVVESVMKKSILRSSKNNSSSGLEVEMKKLIDAQINNYLISKNWSMVH